MLQHTAPSEAGLGESAAAAARGVGDKGAGEVPLDAILFCVCVCMRWYVCVCV